LLNYNFLLIYNAGNKTAVDTLWRPSPYVLTAAKQTQWGPL